MSLNIGYIKNSLDFFSEKEQYYLKYKKSLKIPKTLLQDFKKAVEFIDFYVRKEDVIGNIDEARDLLKQLKKINFYTVKDRRKIS